MRIFNKKIYLKSCGSHFCFLLNSRILLNHIAAAPDDSLGKIGVKDTNESAYFTHFEHFEPKRMMSVASINPLTYIQLSNWCHKSDFTDFK